MREMTSGISTNPQRLVRGVGEAVSRAHSQQVQAAASEVAVTGTADPDYKKSVTEAFTGMFPVHKTAGSAVVGSLAYRTNALAWRDYSPGFFDGLLAPQGEYNSKPFYHTDMAAAAIDPSVIKTAGVDEMPAYGQVVTPNRSQARPFTTRVVQDTDTF